MTNKKTYLVIKQKKSECKEAIQTFEAILTEDGETVYENTKMTVIFSENDICISTLGGEFFPDADMKMEALFLMKWMDERCRKL